MIIGIPRETKPQENRIALTPAGVDALVRAGHAVLVEAGAGHGSGFADGEYAAIGARIEPEAAALYGAADLVVKVKEPQPAEFDLLREGQTLFTYLHLAADAALTEALLRRRIIGIAYETVQLPDGSLPLLAPMSAIAGRMAVQVGAHLLEKVNGGRGILLGGVPGVERGRVVVIGGGHVGTNAIKMAVGLGAQVTVLDISTTRLDMLDDLFGGRIETLMSNEFNIEEAVRQADLVIGAVLIPGARPPKLVRESMVRQMKPGSVLVDVAIDQGGSIETIDRRTTHENPCFIKHGIVHYSVANMPGAVPRTATFALANATLPYVLKLANLGPERAMLENPALLRGLNVHRGALACQAVAESLGLPFMEAEAALGIL